MLSAALINDIMTIHIPDYALLDHTADLGIKVRGVDLKDLFETAAKALMHLMTRGESPGITTEKNITVSGRDLPDLLVRWLGEILYLLEGEDLVVTSVHIDSVFPSRLDATLQVIPFDPAFHRIRHEIKAVTYHQIQVMNKGSIWEAQVIFDT